MSKPVCANCGKRYGYRATRNEEFVVEIGQPIPGPKSKLKMIREQISPALPPPGQPDVHWGNGVPMDPAAAYPAKYEGRWGRRVRRTFWDGETYTSGFDPFCTLRCVEAFAQAAYKAGHRIAHGSKAPRHG